jgi:hypothetical protein
MEKVEGNINLFGSDAPEGQLENETVKYRKYERNLGLHKVQGVKVNGKWRALRQFQLVNDKWTQAGCNWYGREEIRRLLEEEAQLIDSGEAHVEKVGQCERQCEILIIESEEGEYMV